MKNVIKKATVALSTLLLVGQFMSCDTATTSTKNQVASVHINNTSTKKLAIKKPVVFISGIDQGDSYFYTNAREYFKEKNYQIVEGAYSLEEIINWLNNNADNKAYGEIHIVNENNPFKGMNLETLVNGEKVTTESLQKNMAQGTLPAVKNGITADTDIVFHSQNLAENTELLKALKGAFVSDQVPNVIATPYYTVFGGEFQEHCLAQPYYVFYPTANSPGKVDLSKEIAKKYPTEKDIVWLEALNNERERYIGEAYTVQYTVPVTLEMDYHNSDYAVPTFDMQEEVMDFIELDPELLAQVTKTNIPVDKFRWTWKSTSSKVTLKGKATVLCVLKPLTKPYGDLEHVEPDTKNKRLYAMK